MSIKCWVVMGNDYPAAVFVTEAAANEYILMRRWEHLVQPDHERSHIHWRHYEFELDSEFTPETLRTGKEKGVRAMTNEELRREWFFWFHRERKQGPTSTTFMSQVGKDLARRGIDVSRLVNHYHTVVASEHSRLNPRNYPRRTPPG